MLSLFVILLSMNNMIIEFALAQLHGSVFGSTSQSYAMTFGFYILGMGLGTFRPFKLIQKPVQNLIFIERCIAGLLLGASLIYPFLIKIGPFAGFLFIFSIAFLSGIEFPITFHLLKNTVYKGKFNKTLSLDFLGMFIATLLFGFFFMKFGLIPFIFFAIILNLVLSYFTAINNFNRLFIVSCLFTAISLTLFLNSYSINSIYSRYYLWAIS